MKDTVRPPWYVADMDTILAVCAGRDEALAWLREYTRDVRTAPFIERLSVGMYAYTGPATAGPGTSETYWYGTREALILNGFDIHIAKWEKKEVLS